MRKQYKVEIKTGKNSRFLDPDGYTRGTREEAAAFALWKQAQQAALHYRSTVIGCEIKIHEEVAPSPAEQVAQVRKAIETCWLNLQNTYVGTTGRVMTCQKEAIEDVLNSLSLLGGCSKEILALLPSLSKDALRKLAREVVRPWELNPEVGEAGEMRREQVVWNFEEVSRWNTERAKANALRAKNEAIRDARGA